MQGPLHEVSSSQGEGSKLRTDWDRPLRDEQEVEKPSTNMRIRSRVSTD